jgi:antirestriction protein
LDLSIGDVPPADRWTARLPMPYVPCPDRRVHTRLIDCWLCWSDVKRGAAREADVLTPATVAAA